MNEEQKAWKLLFERFKEREPDCPACAQPHQPGRECQQEPWAEFREYLPIYCNYEAPATPKPEAELSTAAKIARDIRLGTFPRKSSDD